ncbi:unnamed protein product [Didymodactylos carnosus]|uniref:Reverse transcriptase/retrotransposon-derived protein RNase H-like domain-containing protein n=1 Tax=Didymodactylos carnosus TaxID=1234261 RepID=A0A814H3M3_9BILA|nr:unnamed protein product [Didymodactylos carnosus]CAF3776049.1 unnamed protein product [Didymodactylos carnosus]
MFVQTRDESFGDDVADVMWSVLIVFVVGLFEYSIDFAKTAAPLYKFTKKNAVFNKSVCGDKERIAYNTIKENLTTPPLLLHFPDDESKLVLETDASGIDLGAILRQMTLHGPKGREFSVETDHCPLCNFHKKTSKNGRADRWSLELAEYDITEIKYKKGKCHCGPDLLSRYMKIELFDQENDARLLKQSNDSQQQQDVQEIQQQCNVITRARVNNTAQSATRHAPVAVNRNSS